MERLGTTNPAGGTASGTTAAAPRPSQPLRVERGLFWGEAGERADDVFGTVEIPRASAALARRLGGFPFWQGETPFLDTTRATYDAASQEGLDVFRGPASGVDRSETHRGCLTASAGRIRLSDRIRTIDPGSSGTASSPG